jgi:hypothetical protein
MRCREWSSFKEIFYGIFIWEIVILTSSGRIIAAREYRVSARGGTGNDDLEFMAVLA